LGILATSNKNILNNIKKELTIWNINSFAEYFLQIYGKYDNDYISSSQKFIEERNWFYAKLCNIKELKVFPSQANYFLCKLVNGQTSEDLAKRLLSNHNILIKDCGNKRGFEESVFFRIAIRSNNDNSLLISALSSELKCKELS
jgi:histidinol-phosphate/aromatic aminotransferase/cobyric acid decarboxylase-like protein